MRVANVSFVSQLIVLIVLELLVTANLLLAFADLGEWTLPVALGIAGLMATLVALYFMELIEEKASVRWAFAAALAFYGLLLGITSAEVVFRPPQNQETYDPPPRG